MLATMSTLTIRNVPERVVERIKTKAGREGRSMEQEVRDLLVARYADRAEVLEGVRRRWGSLPATSAAKVKRWRDAGRR